MTMAIKIKLVDLPQLAHRPCVECGQPAAAHQVHVVVGDTVVPLSSSPLCLDHLVDDDGLIEYDLATMPPLQAIQFARGTATRIHQEHGEKFAEVTAVLADYADKLVDGLGWTERIAFNFCQPKAGEAN